MENFKRHPFYNDYMFNEVGDCYSVKTNKILKYSINKQGYLRYALFVNKKIKTISAHRLVAQTFISNENNYNVVNHKNGVKNDNRVENLEWCTQSYNIKHAFETGLNKVSEKAKKMSSARTKKLMLENHPNKRKVSCFTKTNEIIKTFDSIRDASKYYNILESSISNCLVGRSVTCDKKIWKYE